MASLSADYPLPPFVADWIKAELAAGRDAKPRVTYAAAKGDDRDTITVYGPIGGWYGMNDTQFSQALDKAEGKVLIRVNSPGGDAFMGISMMNQLHDYPEHVRAQVDDWALSAASILIMGANERVMARGTQLMIHEAGMVAWGNKRGLRKGADILDSLDQDLAELYAEVGNGDAAHYMAAMEEETWYRAADAVKEGLADRQVAKKAKPKEAQDKGGAGEGATDDKENSRGRADRPRAGEVDLLMSEET